MQINTITIIHLILFPNPKKSLNKNITSPFPTTSRNQRVSKKIILHSTITRAANLKLKSVTTADINNTPILTYKKYFVKFIKVPIFHRNESLKILFDAISD